MREVDSSSACHWGVHRDLLGFDWDHFDDHSCDHFGVREELRFLGFVGNHQPTRAASHSWHSAMRVTMWAYLRYDHGGDGKWGVVK